MASPSATMSRVRVGWFMCEKLCRKVLMFEIEQDESASTDEPSV